MKKRTDERVQMKKRTDEREDKHRQDLEYVGKGKTIFFSMSFIPIIFVLIASEETAEKQFVTDLKSLCCPV